MSIIWALFWKILFSCGVLYGVYVIIFRLAEKNRLITLVKPWQIKGLIHGGAAGEIIPNTPGWYLNDEGILTEESKVPNPKKDTRSWLNKKYEVYLIGLPPVNRVVIHEFPRTLIALKNPGKEIEGDMTAIITKVDYTDYLAFQSTFPLKAWEVELGDNFKVNIEVELIVQAYKPAIPLFVLKGKYLMPLFAAVEGAINDYGSSTKSFDDFREQDKEGPDSIFSKTVMAINWHVSPDSKAGKKLLEKAKEIFGDDPNMLDKIKGKPISESIGVIIVGVNFKRFDQAFDPDGEAKKAVEAKGIAKLKGEARLIEAEYEALSVIAVGEAESGIFDQKSQIAAAYGTEETLANEALAKPVGSFSGAFLNMNSTSSSAPPIAFPLDSLGQNPDDREVKSASKEYGQQQLNARKKLMEEKERRRIAAQKAKAATKQKEKEAKEAAEAQKQQDTQKPDDEPGKSSE